MLVVSGMIWVAVICAEGVRCDLGGCGCELRASGVMWVAVVVS